MRLAIVCDRNDYEMMSAHLNESPSIVCVPGDEPQADLGSPDVVILWNATTAGRESQDRLRQWRGPGAVSSDRQAPIVAVAIPWKSDTQVPELLLDHDGLCARIGEEVIALTPTQFAILEYLVRNRDSWRHPATIMREVLGTFYQKNTSLMRFHIHKLRAALGQYAECIRWQRGRGYMFSTERCTV